MIRLHDAFRIAGGLAASLLVSAAPALAQDCEQKVPDSALVSPGKLTMSTNPTLPPMQFVDSSGQLKGMRITLGDEIAKRLCLEPEYVRIEFSAMIPGLQAGRWDVINTGIFWNPERAEMMKMVPYEQQAISISAQKGNPEGISKEEDLAGKTVGVEIGGFEEAKLKALDEKLQGEGLEAMNIRTFDNFALAYQALAAGQTDATVSIDPTAAEYANRGDFDRAISGLFPTPVALAMQNEEVADAVVEALNSMMEDGSYKTLMDEYGLLANTEPFALRGPND
ncbi:ABC transporter substrate-binding protein [Jiella mangrovi]|uniref:ABC transporter substrate-binding protein n=1 Tax=Jiella mangrovi TaxID=2821407 RepID=A0ABS4BKX5_9HYPH|nr:ABC transporter substrate-binding protein [Jiella mangrovi]MBP0616836.1 ABC transporter substrate-binding protein [Jiella mangrovi]